MSNSAILMTDCGNWLASKSYNALATVTDGSQHTAPLATGRGVFHCVRYWAIIAGLGDMRWLGRHALAWATCAGLGDNRWRGR